MHWNIRQHMIEYMWLVGPRYRETNPHQVIFHPLTGLSVQRKSSLEPLRLFSCNVAEAWSYTPQKTLSLKKTNLCLKLDGLGKPAKLGNICSDYGSHWETFSDSMLHLSSTIGNATTLCLDVDSSHTVVTNTCNCLSNSRICSPEGRWFKIITSARSPSSIKILKDPSPKSQNLSWRCLMRILY